MARFCKTCLFSTELGWTAVTVDVQGEVQRLWFGYPSRHWLLEAIESSSNPLERSERVEADDRDCADLVDRLSDYAQGSPADFRDIPVALDGRTGFQRRVIEKTRQVLFGQTVSYGELARRAGNPGAARAVGSVMAHNRVPLIVPCHRVIASGARIGGFSSIDGVDMKRRLLTLEGVEFGLRGQDSIVPSTL